MSIHLESDELVNTQQMEVAVHGPDGATHLILCTGMLELPTLHRETYTFLVGPPITRRQFVSAIASGAISTVQLFEMTPCHDPIAAGTEARLVLINASYDEGYGQVQVRAEVISNVQLRELAISYNVSILAELQRY